MYLHRAALLLLSLPLLVFAQRASAQPAEQPLRYQRDQRGVETSFTISRDQIAKIPAWIPEEGTAPPLQIDVAIRLGRASVEAAHPDLSAFEVRSVEMARINTPHPLPNRWYYFVTFTPMVEGNRVFGGSYVAAVLMDGTILEARVKRPAPEP